MIYIELFASRLPHVFQDNSESFGERNIEREIFEALQCVATIGEGFEETLQRL